MRRLQSNGTLGCPQRSSHHQNYHEYVQYDDDNDDYDYFQDDYNDFDNFQEDYEYNAGYCEIL